MGVLWCELMAAFTMRFLCFAVSAVANLVSRVGGRRIPSEVFKPVVAGDVVGVASHHAKRAGTYERLKDQLMDRPSVPMTR
jgi:hypothetical protein